MKKRYCVIYILLFIVICLFPLCTMPFYANNESAEKRDMQEQPHVRESGKWNREYFAQLTDYFNDHFGYRQEMAGMNAALQQKLFFTSGGNKVIAGSNGWLYYVDTVDDYCGWDRMNARELHNCQRVLYLIERYVKNHGGKFLFAVPPNKNSLYGKDMPYYYRKSSSASDYDRLYRELERNGVQTVNLKQEFLSCGRVLYHKLDTHWNNQGAAMAHNIIMDAFGRESVDFEHIPFRIVKDFTGDLYQMMYPAGDRKDTNVLYQYSFQFQYAGDNIRTDMMQFDTYNESADSSLLMYRDSFGNALAPFMAEEFSHCRFTKAVPYNLSLMEKEKFDYVVIEIAERHLPQLQEGIPVMEAEELDYAPEYEYVEGNDVTFAMEERKDLGLVKLYGYVDSDFTDSASNIYVQIVNSSSVHTYEAFPAVNDVKENTERNDYGYGIYVPQSVCSDADTKIMIITEKGGRMYASKKML